MKNVIRCTLAAGMLAAITQVPLLAADKPAGFVDFGKLDPGDFSSEFVEVNINSNLISMVARIAAKAEPDVAGLLQGLRGIRVNVLGLNRENRDEIAQKIKDVRAQLDTQGWERIVTAKQNREDVGVYLKTRGEEAVEGIVVTVLDGRSQAVFVNIVGDIRPEMIGVLGEKFNIDPLKKIGRELDKAEPDSGPKSKAKDDAKEQEQAEEE